MDSIHAAVKSVRSRGKNGLSRVMEVFNFLKTLRCPLVWYSSRSPLTVICVSLCQERASFSDWKVDARLIKGTFPTWSCTAWQPSSWVATALHWPTGTKLRHSTQMRAHRYTIFLCYLDIDVNNRNPNDNTEII